MKNKIKPYITSILIALGVGALSALFTRENMDLYSTVISPPLAPPALLFPVVWTILYILMGISAAIIYTADNASIPDKKSALYVYAFSLIFNFFWCIVHNILNA